MTKQVFDQIAEGLEEAKQLTMAEKAALAFVYKWDCSMSGEAFKDFKRLIVEARKEGREEMRAAVQGALAHGAPYSPRRYIYDTTPDRRGWANEKLDETIRKLMEPTNEQ